MSVARVLTIVFCLFVAFTLALAIVPIQLDRAGFSGVFIGLVLAGAGLASLIIEVPLAAGSDRRGRRPMILTGGLIMALSGGVMMVAGPVAGAITGLVLFSIASSYASLSALALVSEVGHDRQAWAQGLNGSAQRLGALVASLLTALVIGQDDLVLGGVIIAAVGLAIAGQAMLLPRQAEAAPSPTATVVSSYRQAVAMLRWRYVALSAISNVFIILLLVVSGAFGPLLIVQKFEGSVVVVLAALAARDLAGVLAGPLYTSLVARLGLFEWVTLSSVLGVPGIAMLASTEPVGVILGFLLMGVSISHSVAATNMFAALGSQSRERATALAATGLVGRPAMVAFPLVLGLVLDRGGVTGLSLVAASFGGACVVAIWMLRARTLPAHG